MSARRSTPTRPKLSTEALARGQRRALVDRLLDEYISWREECLNVSLSYARWNRAARHDRALAFAACVAALDREERAAAVYRQLLDRLAAAHGAADHPSS